MDTLLNVDSRPLAELDVSYENLCSAWKVVETKHETYIDLLPDEDAEGLEWIQEIKDSFVGARRRVLAFRAKSEQEYNCSAARKFF